MTIIGIDPGQTGGVAAISDRGKLLTYTRMPIVEHGKRKLVDPVKLDQIFDIHITDTTTFVIEQVGARPRQSATSTFSFGRVTGGVEAWALIYGLPVHWVTPAVWKKFFQLSSDKQPSLDRARLEFGVNKIWDVKANDGIAEAALIALWRLKQLQKRP